MGVGSWGGGMGMAAASVAMRGASISRGGYGGYSEPEKKPENSKMFFLVMLIASLLFLGFGCLLVHFDNSTDTKLYKCTVIGKQVTSYQYKSREICSNEFALMTDTGKTFHTNVGLDTYVMYNPGDKVTWPRQLKDMEPEKCPGSVYGFFEGLFLIIGAAGTFTTLVGGLFSAMLEDW